MKLDEEKYHEDQQVSPGKIAIMLVGLNLVLGLIVYLFPNGERTITDDFSLQFVSASELFNPKEKVVVNLDSVIGDIELVDTVSEVVEVDTSFEEPELDKKLQYPEDKEWVLAHFFEALRAVENGSEEIIRILHYGDSQLEGDRISDFVRHRMQNRFGGYGPGIVLPIDVSRARVSVRQSESRDWKKFAIYSKNRLDNGHYGIGGSAYKYSGKYLEKIGEDTLYVKHYDSLITKAIREKIEPVDTVEGIKPDSSTYKFVEVSIPYDSTRFTWDTIYKPIYESKDAAYSWLRYRCARKSYARVRTFSKVSLMYSSEDSVRFTLVTDGIERSMILPPQPYGGKRLIYDGAVQEEVMFRFTGISPTLMAVFLDGDRGVAVDNFPMRGSSGTGYSMINQRVYRNQLVQANAKLVIMQYGINVVPNPQKNYDYYERLFDSQLKAIKKAQPEVDILVIGPSDMSRKVGGEYVSYPNITLIRDAMKRAAFRNGCAFWDLYSVMGGENSMVSWVNNEPSLAAKDYTHFNARGARYIGEMLYNALMSEYNRWKTEAENKMM